MKRFMLFMCMLPYEYLSLAIFFAFTILAFSFLKWFIRQITLKQVFKTVLNTLSQQAHRDRLITLSHTILLFLRIPNFVVVFLMLKGIVDEEPGAVVLFLNLIFLLIKKAKVNVIARKDIIVFYSTSIHSNSLVLEIGKKY